MERIICLAVGYVCGLFQTSYIIGKMHKTDIREHGSGNAGTTNALRTFGKKAGALTLLGDLLKCMIAVFLVRLIFRREYADIMPLLSVYAAAGCILGHNFPVYLKFRGGKGVAASVGFVLAFDWRIFVIGAVVFFTLFFLTHYVSLCSLSAYVTALIVMIIFGQMGSYKMDASHTLEMYAVMAALTVLAFYKHRENIKRLVHGSISKRQIRKSIGYGER